MSRDWTSTLWPASFMGFPFYVARDGETGGRRLGIHEFPNSDEPYIEDLGRKAKTYRVTLYLASDSADAAMASLAGLLDGGGVGTLVLPLTGPVQARCGRFTRTATKDRLGYVAFQVEFWAQGMASPSPSGNYLAQIAFDAIDAVALASSGIVSAMSIIGFPAFVVASAVSALQNIPATLEVIRSTRAVDPTLSPAIATAVSTVYNEIPLDVTNEAVSPAFVADLFSSAGELCAALDPSLAAPVFAAAIPSFPPAVAAVGASVHAGVVAVNAEAANQLARVTLLAAYAQAVIGATYIDRPSGVAARARAVALIGVELETASENGQGDLYSALADLRSSVVDFFTATIADLAPVVTIDAGAQMPALYWAWRLYADPTRAQEIIDRNDVPHPAFVARRFEALAT